jgi:DNA-binding MurR/RpiR family transcriptional regulator
MENINVSVKDNIKQLYDELFAAEKKVASYILENM